MLGSARRRPDELETNVKQKVVLVAVATLMSGMLTACGGGGEAAAYCDSLEEAEQEFGTLESGDFASLDEALDKLHELADEAPDDVKDDWETVDGALTDMEQAFEDAGLELADLEGITNGEIPEGVDVEKLTTLTQELGQITSGDFEAAANNIEKHAKDECDVDLGGS
jgi:hypothetical protein